MQESIGGSPIDRRLLNEYQQDFPLCPAPFAVLAQEIGVPENVLMRSLEQMRRDGRLARVGAVFAPKRIGSSTLATLAVPPERLDVVAATVTRFPEVHHCVRREHRYNLWFVVTAGSEGRVQAALGAIAQSTGLPILPLPLLREYHGPLRAGEAAPPVEGEVFLPPGGLDEVGRRLVMALLEGVPIFIRPFSLLASRVGCSEEEVIERIRRWLADGMIKRFGLIAREREGDACVQAMLVHDVPDEEAGRCGGLLAGEPDIALCYQRPRVLPEWPYNLFCVIRGRVRSEVQAHIDELRRRLDLSAYAHAVLFVPPGEAPWSDASA